MTTQQILRDGRPAFLRALSAQEGDAVQRFVRELSPQARLERFFAPVKELTAQQLERVMRSPGLNLAACSLEDEVVGLAQYVHERGGHAEFAVVVADAWQGIGLGEALVSELLDHARRSGLASLEGVIRPYNTPMRRLAAKLGFALKRDEDPQLIRVERVLAGEPRSAPRSEGGSRRGGTSPIGY